MRRRPAAGIGRRGRLLIPLRDPELRSFQYNVNLPPIMLASLSVCLICHLRLVTLLIASRVRGASRPSAVLLPSCPPSHN